jgi:hypothetical protein
MGYRVKEIVFFVKAWGDRSLRGRWCEPVPN